MSTLQERLRWQANVTRMGTAQESVTDCALLMLAADALDAAEAKLAAIDAVLVTYSAGPPEMAPLLDDLYRILHPEEGDQ